MPLHYLLYARKSSESEDRQVQSLDDQVRIMRDTADRFGLNVAEILTESKSAKAPGTRPVFTAMLRMLREGKADALLCWNVNRLSRNPVESGEIQWLLQEEKIKEIRTVDRVFLPSDNALLLAIEASQSNQYIRELRQNVKRGMLSRAEKGWCSHMAPEGYHNDREGGTVVEDPARMPHIERMFRLVLTGECSVPQVLDTLNDGWGYRTKPSRRTPSGRLSRAGVYKILKNPFYAGFFSYEGRLYEGRHRAIISWAEHERILEILGLRKPAPRTNEFAYSLTIRCGACGRFVCGLRKTKAVKSINSTREYVYYYCANSQCPDRAGNSITEGALERLIEARLKQITIMPEFLDLALEGIARFEATEAVAVREASSAKERLETDMRKRLDDLLDLRLAGFLDDGEYGAKKAALTREIERLQGEHRDRDRGEAPRPWDAVRKAVSFAASARRDYTSDDARTKRQIARQLGAKYVLQRGELTIVTSGLFAPIAEGFPALAREFEALEPAERASLSTKTEALQPLVSTWWTIVAAIRTAVLDGKGEL